MRLCVANVGITITNFISEPEVLKSIKAPPAFGNKIYFFACACHYMYQDVIYNSILKEVAELFCSKEKWTHKVLWQ
jgi:hypothetical protein